MQTKRKIKNITLISFLFFIIFIAEISVCIENLPIYSDPLNPIEIGVGQEFAISLDSNQSTGYKWQFSKPLDQDLLKLVRTEYKPQDNENVNAGGKEIFVFRGINKGTTMISLKYSREWEKDLYPLESRTFIVIIHDANIRKSNANYRKYYLLRVFALDSRESAS